MIKQHKFTLLFFFKFFTGPAPHGGLNAIDISNGLICLMASVKSSTHSSISRLLVGQFLHHHLDLAAVLGKRSEDALLAGHLVAFFGYDVACHAAAVRPELVVGAPELQVVLLLCQFVVKGQLGLVVE